MKNIVEIQTSQHFLCYSVFGGDFITCPICGTGDFASYYDDEFYTTFTIDKNIDIYELCKIEDEIKHIYFKDMKYCNHCHILFDEGSESFKSKPGDEVMNGLLIYKWEHNGIMYIGMPQFDDINDWLTNIKDVTILEIISPNDKIVFKMGQKQLKEN